jgi:hypothetical protein
MDEDHKDGCFFKHLRKPSAYFYEKLLRGVQGGSFLEKRPPGRRRQRKIPIEVQDGQTKRFLSSKIFLSILDIKNVV